MAKTGVIAHEGMRHAVRVTTTGRVAALALTLILAGCSSAAPPDAGGSRPATTAPTTTPSATAIPSPTPTPSTPTPSPSPPCGTGRPTGTSVLSLPQGRRALLAVPAGDDGRRRLPLVVALPGYGQTAEQLAAQSRLPQRAIVAGALAVLPEGAGSLRAWDLSTATPNAQVAFLSSVVSELVGHECADPSRIVIAGISDGGDMAAIADCALPGRFRALVTVAASIAPRPGCHPTPIVAVHGDLDPLDPYRGGVDGRPGYPDIPPAKTAIAAWAALDGCHTATTTQLAPHIVRTEYPCGPQLITVLGGGHTWPGGAAVAARLGVTTSEYDVTATILGLL